MHVCVCPHACMCVHTMYIWIQVASETLGPMELQFWVVVGIELGFSRKAQCAFSHLPSPYTRNFMISPTKILPEPEDFSNFLKGIYFYFYLCICVYKMYDSYLCSHKSQNKVADSPRTWVTEDCEPPNIGARIWIRVLLKKSHFWTAKSSPHPWLLKLYTTFYSHNFLTVLEIYRLLGNIEIITNSKCVNKYKRMYFI